MIDWVTFIAPLDHDMSDRGPFYAGEVLSTQPDPTSPDGVGLEWGILKRKKFPSSWDTVIQVKSCTDETGRPSLWVSGNPSKWFQGHNVFGSDDLPGLVLEMLHRICASVGVEPSANNLAEWSAHAVKLTRVDITYSFQLGTVGRVRAALRALDQTANLKHRGRGHYRGDSLTFGEKSRRWSLTLYAKGPELKIHKLPFCLVETSIPALADGLLRAECRLLSMELVAEQLDRLSSWGDNTPAESHFRYMMALQIADSSMIDAPTFDGLSGRLQLAYQSWKAGHDLRATLSRPTFYRYRSELLPFGVDIAVKQARSESEQSNVVPLRTVLHAQPFHVPDWALGTPFYFEPRAKAA